jgi:hypothetical protein
MVVGLIADSKKEKAAQVAAAASMPVKVSALPIDNIAMDTISEMPENSTAWTSPESMCLNDKGEVLLWADKPVSATKNPDDIKVTKSNGLYSINLSGTKHKWKVPLNTLNWAGMKTIPVVKVEQEIPLEKP